MFANTFYDYSKCDLSFYQKIKMVIASFIEWITLQYFFFLIEKKHAVCSLFLVLKQANNNKKITQLVDYLYETQMYILNCVILSVI